MTQFFYHGGVDGLRVGDVLTPGMERKHHDGCQWCEARAKGEAFQGMDGPSQEHAVYFTPVRLYAKFHASLYGRGDLYRVEPIGVATDSEEDSIESYHAPQARIVSVYERAVLLTNTERRKLDKLWLDADVAMHNRITQQIKELAQND
jgi:hypothetical protein